jgi:leucyl/phenylalanyl-tRNA--protein transferase
LFLTFTPTGIEFAYRRGIFPMQDSRTGELHWFQPDPRTILPLDGFHISRSLARTIRQGRFEVSFDRDFEGVMRACADREEGTWISEEFIAVYGALHRVGKTHSVEVWRNGRLVGGTYGVALGGAFMGESMFHRETDASKVALAALVERLNARGYALLDVQYLTPHLQSLGAVEIPHRVYYDRLRRALRLNCRFNPD